MYSQQEYIATGLALYKNILLPAIHRASPLYSQMAYIGTGLVYAETDSTDGAILLSKLLLQSNETKLTLILTLTLINPTKP